MRMRENGQGGAARHGAWRRGAATPQAGESARAVASELLRQRTEGLELSASLRVLLLFDWRHLLERIHVRFGTGSPEWRAAVGLIDEILGVAGMPMEASAREGVERLLREVYRCVEAAFREGRLPAEVVRTRHETLGELRRRLPTSARIEQDFT